jgi:hypothetical protein
MGTDAHALARIQVYQAMNTDAIKSKDQKR